MELTKATLAGGCFWCLEAVYQRIEGIHRVVSGYTGGHTNNPDYRSICSGMTGHAEVVQLDFDSETISYFEVLDWFWRMHDPTTLNRQGNDVGTQYRSAIFYQNDLQKTVAERYIAQLDAARVFSSPIVTRLEPLQDFFEAEAYHQNYASQHPGQPYIAAVALPKLDKLREYFGDRLKP